LNLMAKQEPLGGIQAKRAELKNRFCLRGHMTFTKTLEKLYVGLKTNNRFCGYCPDRNGGRVQPGSSAPGASHSTPLGTHVYGRNSLGGLPTR
jgi:hypothetical protein